MLVIRYFRVGKKNQPSFKIVVTDKRQPTKAGVFIEEVGFWNPLTKEKFLRKERISYWLSVGAKPSASIYNLLVAEKIMEGKKIPKQKKKKVKEESKEVVVPQAKATKEPEKAKEKVLEKTEKALEKKTEEKKEEKVKEKPPQEKAEDKK